MEEDLVSRQGAESLRELHDELDRIDRKERLGGVGVALLIFAATLVVLGLARGSVVLEVNGLLLGVGGVVLGAKEISRWRRMRSLGREIDRIEDSLETRTLGQGRPEASVPGSQGSP